MDSCLLDVIHEDGTVLRQATRREVHERGLLHEEVHVWFYTVRGEVFFQHRAKDKDTHPDMLDATVGGHVEAGDTYEETVIRETEEETGIRIKPENLTFLRTTITRSYDPVTGMTNHARRNVYAYRCDGRLEDLKVEEGQAIGFEACMIDRFLVSPEQDAARFNPSVFRELGVGIMEQIRDLIKGGPFIVRSSSA